MMALSRLKVIAVIAAVLFGIIFTLPNVLRITSPGLLAKMPPVLQKTLNLGLDLQGGSQLQYEVDTVALEQSRLTALEEDLRTQLTDDNIAFDQLAQVNKGVQFRVLDPTQTTTIANNLRGKVGGALGSGQSNVLIQPQDDRVRITFVPQAANEAIKSAVIQSIEVIRRRIDASGTKEPAITPQGASRIVIEAPGEANPENLKALVGQTAKLTFHLVDEVAMQDPNVAANIQRGQIPPGDIAVYTSPSDPYNQGRPLLLKKRVVLSGEQLVSATQSFDSQTNEPVVSFRAGGKGARDLTTATTENIGKRFAVVLDNQIITAPVINGALPGGGQITGNFTIDSAANLALLLRSGALPAKLNVINQTTVGAELGADSIRQGMISLAIGGVAILIFIMLAYGLFGLFAGIALIINVLLILACMSVSGATLTFPGIAGLILTLAVAVDANVLIYERVRDEAHAGRSVISAIDHGYARALVSILDANITSAISAIIMLFLGAGPVKGFAWALLIGVITSVFTAVVVTQVLVALWFRAKRPKVLPIA
ncbi:MAG: secD [Caulobacteraceae bacterium]|nr:secD [Caulobacteraceae bacterium]